MLAEASDASKIVNGAEPDAVAKMIAADKTMSNSNKIAIFAMKDILKNDSENKNGKEG